MTTKSHLISDDSIFHGRLCLRQHRQGYRFTEDAVILAAFAARYGRVEVTADLGAGCGVVGLALLSRRVTRWVIALELQRGLAGLVHYNSVQNGLNERISVLRSDLRSPPIRQGSVDLIVSNPPYRKSGRGRLPENQERALARHELTCTPDELFQSAATCLKPDGRLVAVYPFDRLDEVLQALPPSGLHPRRLRMVHPSGDQPPSLFLVEARLGLSVGGYDTEPPLFAHEREGSRGAEMERILSGDW